jgi:hypothetical protein
MTTSRTNTSTPDKNRHWWLSIFVNSLAIQAPKKQLKTPLSAEFSDALQSKNPNKKRTAETFHFRRSFFLNSG